MTLPPQMGKVTYGPGCVLLITAKTNLLGVDGFGEVDLGKVRLTPAAVKFFKTVMFVVLTKYYMAERRHDIH